jgi:hypothetical protein
VRWFATQDRSTTLCTYLLGSLRRFRCGGRDFRTTLCGRVGAALRWFAGYDRLTTLRDWISMSTRPGGYPGRSLGLRAGTVV